MYKVPFIKPNMPDATSLGKIYEGIVAKNWFTNFGAHEKELSSKLGAYISGDAHATTISNATTGLMLAIRNLMQPKSSTTRKKVLMPAFTFAAGVEALIWSGLEVVYPPTIHLAHINLK